MAETEINFWVMPNAGFSTRPILAEAIEEFEQLNPDVKIRLTVHPWSLSWARSMDVIKGRFEGPRPDVLQVGTTWVPTLVYLGALDEVPSTQPKVFGKGSVIQPTKMSERLPIRRSAPLSRQLRRVIGKVSMRQ
jgi:multiple sugar transport system substrate-binding protein